jgi:hypothetical protein
LEINDGLNHKPATTPLKQKVQTHLFPEWPACQSIVELVIVVVSPLANLPFLMSHSFSFELRPLITLLSVSELCQACIVPLAAFASNSNLLTTPLLTLIGLWAMRRNNCPQRLRVPLAAFASNSNSLTTPLLLSIRLWAMCHTNHLNWGHQHQHCLQVPHCTFFLLLYIVGNGNGDDCGGNNEDSDSGGNGDNDNNDNDDNNNDDLENLAQEKL